LNYKSTPYEKKEGVKPSVKDFKIFGCKAYVHVPKDLRKKLDDQGVPAIFVGYSDQSSGYEFYNLITGKFFIAGSAIFDENDFPGHELSEEYKEQMVNDDDMRDEDYNPEDDDEDDDEYEYEEDDSERKRKKVVHFNEEKEIIPAEEENIIQGNENEENLIHGNVEENQDDGDDSNDERDAEYFDNSVNDPDYEEGIAEANNDSDHRTLRRSERIRNINEQRNQGILPGFFGRFLKMNGKEKTLNYFEAKKSPKWREYKLAMYDFIKKLDENNGFSLATKPNNVNIIGSRWVFVDKYDASGKFVKAKARLTPLGYQQKKGIDYKETFAPVVMTTSSRLIHVLGLKWGRQVKSFDVENAFQITKLNNEKVFMEIPQGFEYYLEGFDRSKQCLILHNAINGLKQSGNEFYKKLNGAMRELGFQNLKSDPCVYFKLKCGKMIIVGVHVDDAKFVAQTDELESEFIEKFNILLKTSGSGLCDEFLKTKIVQAKDYVSFDQTAKIIDYCKEFQVTKPLHKFEMDINEIMKDERKFEDQKKYQSAIGGLVYLANSYRPDISTAVGQLSSFNANPKECAWRAVIRLYGYLLGTKDLKLVYERPKDTDAKFKIEVYADSNYNDAHLESKSRSGYLIFVDNCLVSWYSKKQSLTAMSTEEAEIFAANEAAKSIAWLLNFMNELNLKYEMPIMHEDCNNAILWINEKRSTMRTRHFHLRLHFIREMVEDNMLKVQYINTSENVADMMTKVIGNNKLLQFAKKIGLENINSEEVLKN
jgi:hypothetical protein